MQEERQTERNKQTNNEIKKESKKERKKETDWLPDKQQRDIQKDRKSRMKVRKIKVDNWSKNNRK